MEDDEISDEQAEKRAIMAVTLSAAGLGYVAGHKIQDLAQAWQDRFPLLQKLRGLF